MKRGFIIIDGAITPINSDSVISILVELNRPSVDSIEYTFTSDGFAMDLVKNDENIFSSVEVWGEIIQLIDPKC